MSLVPSRARVPILAAAAALALAAVTVPTQAGAASTAPPPPAAIVFKDVAAESGITFVHNPSKTAAKHLAETMAAGGALLDYDRDGDLDLFLVNGAPIPGYQGPPNFGSALYRNEGNGRFTDVTAESGAKSPGYGIGVCAGDYDDDGYQDLYVTNWGPNAMFHNEGDGRFVETTAATGTGDPLFGASCAFFDPDGDGDLDLYVANYTDASLENNPYCGDKARNIRAYCNPLVYKGARDVLYRNNGDGTFTDANDAFGVTQANGYGLGVTTGDYDNDGDTDLYIANDMTINVLYRNDGGKLTDVSLLAGVGFGLDGLPQSGMGTDFGDYDGDGNLDIVVTNFDVQNDTLYHNEGGGVFADESFPSGVGAPSLNTLAFGVHFLDYDNDGWLDLMIANGHIMDNMSHFSDTTTTAEPNFLHRNRRDGTFEEIAATLGPDLTTPNVARGLALGDVDLDGDLDVLMTINAGRPRLFRNDGGNARASLLIRLAGTISNRDAIGARATIVAGGLKRIQEIHQGSYASQGDTRILLGLGDAKSAESLEIRWPSGRVDRFKNVAAGSVTLVEGEGDLRR
jgi:hypothetical protein